MIIVLNLFNGSGSCSIFKTKSELALIMSAIFIYLSTIPLRKTIYEPSFVDVRMTTILASLILKYSTEAMEVLGVAKNLALINEVILFPYLNQLSFKSIWAMNCRLFFHVLCIIEGRYLEVRFLPILLIDVDALGGSPTHELAKLASVLTEERFNILILFILIRIMRLVFIILVTLINYIFNNIFRI